MQSLISISQLRWPVFLPILGITSMEIRNTFFGTRFAFT